MSLAAFFTPNNVAGDRLNVKLVVITWQLACCSFKVGSLFLHDYAIAGFSGIRLIIDIYMYALMTSSYQDHD